MESQYKRINVMLREDQYQTLLQRGLNISGLVRDLIGDYLSANTITVQVSEDTRRLYDLVVSNTGASDAEVETHLRVVLAKVLEQRINQMQTLHQQLVSEQDPLNP